tara:strand:- start:1462 stop:1752 length:291 start_codon:yes stop_codon:yes gene_type:complete
VFGLGGTMSIYKRPFTDSFNISEVDEMLLKNKYFRKLAALHLELDEDDYDLASNLVSLGRPAIERIWCESLEDRYEARDYIIDNWDKSRYTNPNID